MCLLQDSVCLMALTISWVGVGDGDEEVGEGEDGEVVVCEGPAQEEINGKPNSKQNTRNR